MAKKTTVKCSIPPFALMLEKARKATIEEAGEGVEGEAKRTAPRDTSYYANNIFFDHVNKVIANASYSADLEYGTKPHVIKPKNKKFLKFQIEDKEVFTKEVHHPGTKPLAIMRNAAATVQKQVDDMFFRNWAKVAKKYKDV